MQNIRLICVGKLKESYFKEAQTEYQKRLNAYCRLNLIEIPEHRLNDTPSPIEIEKALAAEGTEILQKVRGILCTLCIEGKELSSPALAKKMNEYALNGASEISFVIGGSYGLSESVKQKAQWKLSMSPMTFPHHLARVMLLEQLYRAYSINQHGKYHK